MTEDAKKKPTVEVEVNTPTKRAPRRKAPAKAAAPEPDVKKDDSSPEPAKDQNDTSESLDVEEVIPLTEKPYIPVGEDEVIATELAAIPAEEKKEGQAEEATPLKYTIGTTSAEMLNGNGDDQYPLGVWVRNADTMHELHARAQQRWIDDNARPSDYMLIDYAEQNAILADRHMVKFFARDGGNWNNYLPVGDRKLRNSKVNFQTGSINGNADRVTAALMRKLDIGIPIVVRLWHSGIVFSINPPSKADRIQIVDKLNQAHLQCLRRTNGLIHGTSAYYANRIIINEFMKHVTASNIDRSNWAAISSIMDHRDIQFMALGLMMASHTRGYKLIEQCGGFKSVLDADGKPVINDEGKEKKTICAHKHESVIDFNLMYAIDNSMFTEWQKELISRKIDENNPVTLEDIEKYQSQGLMHAEERIEIDEELSVIVKAPKAALHIEIGEEWIDSVERAVDDIISANADDETKNEYINRQLEATASMDVAHWVIGFDFNGEIIDEREGINRVFRGMANNEKLRDDLFDKIREKMAKRLAAQPAVPTGQCPDCKSWSHEVAGLGTPFYTPIDMVSRFFTLTARSL